MDTAFKAIDLIHVLVYSCLSIRNIDLVVPCLDSIASFRRRPGDTSSSSTSLFAQNWSKLCTQKRLVCLDRCWDS